MTERIVVFRSDQPHRFLSDVCAALAEQVNQPHAVRPADEDVVGVYAEAVVALARLRLEQLRGEPGRETQIAIIAHLIERIRQTKAGEIGFHLADVVDRLHAEAVSELVPS